MTLILELEPEVRQQLELDAAQAGMPVEAWAVQILKEKSALYFSKESFRTGPGLYPQSEEQKYRAQDIEERLSAWDEFGRLAHEYSKEVPLLSDEAVSRESIYGERGL